MKTGYRTPDTSSPAIKTLDGRSYTSFGFGTALNMAAGRTGDPASRGVIASLLYVDLDDYVPDPMSDLDLGPDQDKGIDWANCDWHIQDDDNGDHSTADIANVLLRDADPLVQALGANIRIFAQHHLFPTTHLDACIVMRMDADFDANSLDDIDLDNITAWR